MLSWTVPMMLLAAAPSHQGTGIREAIQQIAVDLDRGGRSPNRSQQGGTRITIAVTDLPDLQGVTSDFGRFVAERLSTQLSQNPGFLVVERRRFTQVIGELNLSTSDLIDPTKTQRLRKMLGVEALVVGTVSDLGRTVDIDVRVVELSSNVTLTGSVATVTKDDVVSGLLERGRTLGDAQAAPAAVSTGNSSPERYQKSGVLRFPTPVLIAQKKRFGDDATAFLDSLELNVARDLRVNVLLRPSKCPKLFGLHDPKNSIAMRDDKGNSYALTGADGIDEDKGVSVAADTDRRVALSFAAPKPEAKTIVITVAFDYFNIQTDNHTDVGCFTGALNQGKTPKTFSGRSEEIKLEDFR